LVATIALVDTLAEQAELESILEQSKPKIPQDADQLHWLLFTPFRYHPQRSGSRFRAVTDPGVFYAADEIRTSCAELGYWRWRFLMESPDLHALPTRAQSIFSVEVAGTAVDLRAAPFDRDRAVWTDPRDYSGCQRLASSARQASWISSAAGRPFAFPYRDCSQRSSISFARAIAWPVVRFCAHFASGWSNGKFGHATGGRSLRHSLSLPSAAMNVELACCCPAEPEFAAGPDGPTEPCCVRTVPTW